MFEQDNLLQIILEVEYRYNNTLCMFCKVRPPALDSALNHWTLATACKFFCSFSRHIYIEIHIYTAALRTYLFAAACALDHLECVLPPESHPFCTLVMTSSSLNTQNWIIMAAATSRADDQGHVFSIKPGAKCRVCSDFKSWSKRQTSKSLVRRIL